MKNKLRIKKTSGEGKVMLMLDGRIDAYWSSMLEDAVTTEIRSGNYNVYLDFARVDFLSSAGIRILIKSYKELKKINGLFSIVNLTPEIRSIIELVGLEMLISDKPPAEKNQTLPRENKLKLGNTIFLTEPLQNQQKPTIELCGHPSEIFEKKYNEKLRIKKLDEPKFGLGLGAISPNSKDALKRMGEFIALGEAFAYLPTNSSKTPDYSVKTGQLIPEIQCKYGMFFNHAFNKVIHFEHEEIDQDIPFSELIGNICETTGYKTFTLVMIAETSGLVGVSLSKLPSPDPGQEIFHFPEVRENVHFSIEAEHARQLSLITGVFTTNAHDKLAAFLRPLAKPSNIVGHAHAAVFGFQALKKSDLNLLEVIRDCFENEHLVDIMHLINDDREVIGIGESHFMNGMCWVGALDDQMIK